MSDPGRTGRVLWQHVDLDDPYNSGWWQRARLTRWDDGRVELETNTRGSVVPTTITLDDEAVVKLCEALERAGAIATARAEGAVRALKLVTRAVELAPWGVGDPLTIRDELLRALAPDAEVPR